MADVVTRDRVRRRAIRGALLALLSIPLVLDVPVMYQGGTRDVGITPFVRRPGGAYDLTSTPKYFLDLAGAGHFAWTNLNKFYQPLINRYAVAFFDHYLKGATSPDPLAPLLDRPWPQDVGDVKYALP